MTLRTTTAALAIAGAIIGVIAPATTLAAAPSTIGSDGVGDPFFPQAGNGGYDVSDYHLKLDWIPDKRRLLGTARIRATATQNLTQLDLDLRGFTVVWVTVNGQPATFTRSGQELVITPSRTIHTGGRVNVEVRYRGQPEPVIDPDGSSEGWMRTRTGVIALGEPQGSPAWFPVNDHPSDKATFSVEVTVPNGLVAVSNGRRGPTTTSGTTTTYTWNQTSPMSPYLALLAIDTFQVSRSTTSSGIPIIDAVVPSLAAASAPALARQAEMIDWLETIFGPYPFDAAGSVVVDAPRVGYALETQTRPAYTFVPDESTVVHEIAHQWVGNSVAVQTWPEIWLNEGFAGYVEWMWSEHDGGSTAQQIFDSLAATPKASAFWKLPIGPATLPGPADLFADPVYLRGAMTLHALRIRIGDAAFFDLLRTWTTVHRDGNVTTAQFIELAEQKAGVQLDDFFTEWLDTPARPASLG